MLIVRSLVCIQDLCKCCHMLGSCSLRAPVSFRAGEEERPSSLYKQKCCFRHLQLLPTLMLLGTETRAEQLWVSSGVQCDEAWKSKRWQNELQPSVVWTRVCGGQKLIILKCRARGWVSWSAWDLNIFPRIRMADVAYRDHLFLTTQRCTESTARQARQVMLCALAV